jgi:carbonic anhydrase
MKIKLPVFLMALGLASLASAQTVPPHWEYGAPDGPFQWGSMAGYSLCGAGAYQSPIDIESGENGPLSNVTKDTSLEALDLTWGISKFTENFNGHTVQMNYDSGSTLNFEGKSYELKQFHFHSPSEHIQDGRQYPLEMHFVHQSANGTTVVGVFFKEGASNPTLQKIWDNSPKDVSVLTVPNLELNAMDFLPTQLQYYNYTGSLTTPPCTEGVNWIVLKKPIEATADQLRFLQKKLGGPNNRPIEPLDGRNISESL